MSKKTPDKAPIQLDAREVRSHIIEIEKEVSKALGDPMDVVRGDVSIRYLRKIAALAIVGCCYVQSDPDFDPNKLTRLDDQIEATRSFIRDWWIEFLADRVGEYPLA
jgi:hypothetical protein